MILIKISPGIRMKIIYSSDHNNDQACLVYDHIILKKTYRVISEERNVWVNKIASTIKWFQRNLKMRAHANRHLKKEKAFTAAFRLSKGTSLWNFICSSQGIFNQNRLETNFEKMQNVWEKQSEEISKYRWIWVIKGCQ